MALCPPPKNIFGSSAFADPSFSNLCCPCRHAVAFVLMLVVELKDHEIMCNESSCARACVICPSNWWISWRPCNEGAPLLWSIPNIFSAVSRRTMLMCFHVCHSHFIFFLKVLLPALHFYLRAHFLSVGPWAVPCFEEERLCFNLIDAAIFVLVSLWLHQQLNDGHTKGWKIHKNTYFFTFIALPVYRRCIKSGWKPATWCCLSRDFLRKKDTMCLKVVLPDMELQS